MTRRALDLLSSSRTDAYEVALASLRGDARNGGRTLLACNPDELYEDEKPARGDADSLRWFLGPQVLPCFETRRKELSNRHLIREQAFGESIDPHRLDKLARYEVHLDRSSPNGTWT